MANSKKPSTRPGEWSWAVKFTSWFRKQEVVPEEVAVASDELQDLLTEWKEWDDQRVKELKERFEDPLKDLLVDVKGGLFTMFPDAIWLEEDITMGSKNPTAFKDSKWSRYTSGGFPKYMVRYRSGGLDEEGADYTLDQALTLSKKHTAALYYAKRAQNRVKHSAKKMARYARDVDFLQEAYRTSIAQGGELSLAEGDGSVSLAEHNKVLAELDKVQQESLAVQGIKGPDGWEWNSGSCMWISHSGPYVLAVAASGSWFVRHHAESRRVARGTCESLLGQYGAFHDCKVAVPS